MKIYLPLDSAAVALGADEVAAAALGVPGVARRCRATSAGPFGPRWVMITCSPSPWPWTRKCCLWMNLPARWILLRQKNSNKAWKNSRRIFASSS